MISRILQTINTNVREFSGRQSSPVSSITSKPLTTGEDDQNLEDPDTVTHIPQNAIDQKYDAQHNNEAADIQLADSCHHEPITATSIFQSLEDNIVMISQLLPPTDNSNAKGDKLDPDKVSEKGSDFSILPSTRKQMSMVSRSVIKPTADANNKPGLFDRKRKITEKKELPLRKKQKGSKKVTVVTMASPSVQRKSDKPKVRWCRRCGITETCRWRTSLAGSQTACNACYLKCKLRGLPDSEFENFPNCPIDFMTRPSAEDTSIAHKPRSGSSQSKVTEADASAPKTSVKSVCKVKNVSVSKIRPMKCAVIACRATSSPMWRKGPDGTTSLCNKCGIRWAKGKCPELTASLSSVSQVKVTTSPQSVQEPVVNLSKNHQPKSISARKNVQFKGIAQKTTIMLKNGNLPVSERKEFLEAGLYSDQHKVVSRGRNKISSQTTKKFVFSLPEHYGEYLMTKETDFRLSYDIIEAYENDLIGEEAEERKRQMFNPDPFTKVRYNVFVERKHSKVSKESPVCQCAPPTDGTLGCNEDCLNRMMFYECDVKTCPCGKLCSNQRFQRKEDISDLKVFWTDERGWGLRALTDISRGQLIIEYRGEIISQKLCEERVRTVYKDMKNFYFLDYQNGEVIDAAAKGSDARFVNHSCDPNCHIEKWAIGGEICVGVMASKDIPAGSELFYDYNYTVFGSGVSQICRCGSTNCRGFIGKRGSGRDAPT